MCLILILFAAKPYRSAETDGIDCIREKNVSSEGKRFFKVVIVLGISKIMYGGKIMNLITSSFCRAVARHSAPRARPGDAESTDLSAHRAFRTFKFEFHAWVLAEDDRCVERRM